MLMLIIKSAIVSLTAMLTLQPILMPGYATAYCDYGTTKSGEITRNGTCAMHDAEMIGKTVVLYQRLPNGDTGKMIGIYEVKDTGCKQNVIDVWCENLEKCQEFMNIVYEDGCNGRIKYQVINGKG